METDEDYAGLSVLEHGVHVRDLANVPRGDVSIEGKSTSWKVSDNPHKQWPEGPLPENPSTKESHYDNGRVFRD